MSAGIGGGLDRRMAAVKFGGFAKVTASADTKAGNFAFGTGSTAFRTDARLRIVVRSCERFESECAFSTGVIEERHPRHSSPSLERPEASCFKTRIAIP
jgi:hypothetical protein